VQVSQDLNLIKRERQVLRILFATTRLLLSEAKSKVPDWGDKVDSGIGFPMVNVLESTLEWT
jgi:hypothetical protein